MLRKFQQGHNPPSIQNCDSQRKCRSERDEQSIDSIDRLCANLRTRRKALNTTPNVPKGAFYSDPREVFEDFSSFIASLVNESHSDTRGRSNKGNTRNGRLPLATEAKDLTKLKRQYASKAKNSQERKHKLSKKQWEFLPSKKGNWEVGTQNHYQDCDSSSIHLLLQEPARSSKGTSHPNPRERFGNEYVDVPMIEKFNCSCASTGLQAREKNNEKRQHPRCGPDLKEAGDPDIQPLSPFPTPKDKNEIHQSLTSCADTRRAADLRDNESTTSRAVAGGVRDPPHSLSKPACLSSENGKLYQERGSAFGSSDDVNPQDEDGVGRQAAFCSVGRVDNKKTLFRIKKYIRKADILLHKASQHAGLDAVEIHMLTMKAFAFANEAEKLLANFPQRQQSCLEQAADNSQCLELQSSSISESSTDSFIGRLEKDEEVRRMQKDFFWQRLLCCDRYLAQTKTLEVETLQIMSIVNRHIRAQSSRDPGTRELGKRRVRWAEPSELNRFKESVQDAFNTTAHGTTTLDESHSAADGVTSIPVSEDTKTQRTWLSGESVVGISLIGSVVGGNWHCCFVDSQDEDPSISQCAMI